MSNSKFAERKSIEFVEEGNLLAPKFNENGLIPVAVTDYKENLLLMHGYMNEEALEKTLLTGEAVSYTHLTLRTICSV